MGRLILGVFTVGVVLVVCYIGSELFGHPCVRHATRPATCGGYTYCTAYMPSTDGMPTCIVYEYEPTYPCTETYCAERAP